MKKRGLTPPLQIHPSFSVNTICSNALQPERGQLEEQAGNHDFGQENGLEAPVGDSSNFRMFTGSSGFSLIPSHVSNRRSVIHSQRTEVAVIRNLLQRHGIVDTKLFFSY